MAFDYRPPRPHRADPRTLIVKARPGGDDALEAFAAKLETNLAKTILAAFTAQQGSIDMTALEAAIAAGDVGRVLDLLNLPAALAPLGTIGPAVQAGVNGIGAASAAAIAFRAGGVSFAFDTLNPRLITWLQTYSLKLIREINEGTREGVRQFLLDGMKAGKNPKDVARQVRGVVGLTARQSQAVANYRRQLEEFHLKRSAGSWGLGNKPNKVNGTQVSILDGEGANTDGIDTRRLRDFRYDGQLRRAMETGKPLKPEQIDKMVAAYQRKYLAYRSRTIARTEAIRATNMGVQDAWQQALDKGVVKEALVRKKWVVARDERTCTVCGPVPKMNPPKGIPHAASFKTPNGPVAIPPLHPNCRCTVIYRQYEPSQLSNE